MSEKKEMEQEEKKEAIDIQTVEDANKNEYEEICHVVWNSDVSAGGGLLCFDPLPREIPAYLADRCHPQLYGGGDPF